MSTPDNQLHRYQALYDWCGVEIFYYVRKYYEPEKSRILDVGAGWGKYRFLFPDYKMDACEVWQPYIDEENLRSLYDGMYSIDICDMNIVKGQYDVIIFGDVLEHIEVKKAQRLIADLAPKVKDLIVAVPFLYKQGAVDGNPYEKHEQSDLTSSVMRDRYPELVHMAIDDRKGIYVKR